MATLTRAQRERARDRAAQAALLGYRHRSRVHYAQDSRRWRGITNRRNSARGEFPSYADCSGYTTWCLWNGLHLLYGKPDVVNGAHWRAGFTGTQVSHGRRIVASDLMRADLIFYAAAGTTPTHVAICVGRQRGRPVVVSHGSEAGPLFLPWNYRRVVAIRRHIHFGI